jgi:hypothetical protein
MGSSGYEVRYFIHLQNNLGRYRIISQNQRTNHIPPYIPPQKKSTQQKI